MGFYAKNFIYDGIMSSEYGLSITSSSDSDSTSGADVNLYTQQIYRRPKLYLTGVQQSPALSIPIDINVPVELSATEDSVISKWLFGSLNYKKLQIVQPDMQYVYYNCIIAGKQTKRVGNIIRGYSGVISCDSPFAWEFPKTISRSYNEHNYLSVDSFVINNTSDNADYTYPTVSFTMNSYGGDLSIINSSDSNRNFLFTGLLPNEVITVDSDLQIITSSLGYNRLPNFIDYNYMRYVKGANDLVVSGNIISLSFTHQFARKMS